MHVAICMDVALIVTGMRLDVDAATSVGEKAASVESMAVKLEKLLLGDAGAMGASAVLEIPWKSQWTVKGPPNAVGSRWALENSMNVVSGISAALCVSNQDVPSETRPTQQEK